MSRKCLVLATAVLTLWLTTNPALAGGWYHYVRFPELVSPGETLELETEDVWFQTIAQAEEARTQQGYYAFLIEDLDEEMLAKAMSTDYVANWWQLGEASAHHAGTVTAHGGSSNLVDATIRLEIPDVSPGHYWLMLCDLDCGTAMGSVIPREVRVVDDAGFAQLARRIDHLESRVGDLRLNLRRNFRGARNDAETDVGKLRADLRKLRAALRRAEYELGSSLEALGRRVAALEDHKGDGPALAWIGVGGLLAGAFALRRKGTTLRRSR